MQKLRVKVEKVRFVWLCDESFGFGFVHPKTIMKILLHQDRKQSSQEMKENSKQFKQAKVK